MCTLSLENIKAKSIHSQFSERIEHSCPELAWCDFCCIRSLLGTAKAHSAKFAGGLWIQSDMAIFCGLQAPRLPPMLVCPLTKACID